jgi:hypothetical protein
MPAELDSGRGIDHLGNVAASHPLIRYCREFMSSLMCAGVMHPLQLVSRVRPQGEDLVQWLRQVPGICLCIMRIVIVPILICMKPVQEA